MVQVRHQQSYTTHFDLHRTTKFWVHHPHHPTVTYSSNRGLVVMVQYAP